MAKIWKIEGLSLTLIQYIFCSSWQDESIDGIKNEFYYPKFAKIEKGPLSLTSIGLSRMTLMILKWYKLIAEGLI